MKIQQDTTLRDLAVAIPGATTLFEQHRLDYCCGGLRSLGDACAAKGVPSQNLIEALEALAARNPTPPALAGASLTHLVEHLERVHHTYTRDELARLEGLATKVARVHGARPEPVGRVAELVLALRDDLLPHLLREERVLFPYLRALDAAGKAPMAPFGTVQNPVRMMNVEHEQVGELLRELRAVTSEYTPPGDACGSWSALYAGLEALERDLHEHIHLESNVLFPRGLEREAALRAGAVS